MTFTSARPRGLNTKIIKKLQIQKEMREQDDGFDFEDEENGILDDQDYADFYEDIAEQKQKDMTILQGEE